jgi:TP901 family phage tail tape measure protein
MSRMQGLQLGETLEDGTTLNKYSEALQKVGISIFDSAGELKKMDDILDEMGSKWETLNTAQQTALAQTVAGVRQYNQLISLMDNWNAGDSDSMMSNLNTANNASGTLQEQADIYAESWEAARNRVKASAEEIYSALLNDEFFIDLNDSFAKILGSIKNLITAFGGVKGVLATVGFALSSVFKTQLAETIDNLIFSVRGSLGLVKKEMTELQSSATQLLA